MINKNQYEWSILGLKKNIPIYVRKAYTSFVSDLEMFNKIIKDVSENNPYSANEIAKHVICTGDLVKTITKSLGSEGTNLFYSKFIDLYVFDLYNIKADEQFYIVNSADIFAPVESIKSFISPFRSNGRIIVSFEIDDTFTSIDGEFISSSINKFRYINSQDISGMTGENTIFDGKLKSACKIDIDSLYHRFLSEINDVRIDGDTTDYVGKFNEIVSLIKDKNSIEIIERVSKELLKTSIMTYLVFASKLNGVKSDIYKWMYTAFVKDSMTNYDKAHYPVSAPITTASGHAINGLPHGIDSLKTERNYDDVTLDQISKHACEKEEEPISQATIYRNIRLNYSTWAACINSIIYSGNDNKNSIDLPIDNAFEIRKDSINGFRSEFNNLRDFSRKTLVSYLSARYRTYNTKVQVNNRLTIDESSKLIEFVIKLVKDEEAINIIKELVGNKRDASIFSEVFISTDQDKIAILTANQKASEELANMFMDTAYLLILNYIHNTMSKVLEELDTNTGKTNKTIFEEIYFGVKNKILRTLAKFDYDTFSRNNEDIIKHMINACTPYIPVNTISNEYIKKLEDNCNVILRFITEEDNLYNYIKKVENRDAASRIVDIPYVSDFSNIKYKCDKYAVNLKDTRLDLFDLNKFNNTYKGMFPKNKVIVDAMTRLGTELCNKRVFSSLESANESVKTIEQIASEAADSMASNACYSALGCIGGGITELDIRNESDHLEVVNNSIVDDTDANGFSIKPGTTDTEDIKKVISKGLESYNPHNENKLREKIVNDYNKLFNKIIVGI